MLFFFFFVGVLGWLIIYLFLFILFIKDSFMLKWWCFDEIGGDDDIIYIVWYCVEKDNKKGLWIRYIMKGLEYDFSDLDNKV